MVELGNAPAATKVATVFIIIAFVVFLVGFGAPYWRDYPLGGNSGLWQSCGLFLGLDGCSYFTDLDEVGKDSYRTYKYCPDHFFFQIQIFPQKLAQIFILTS